MALTPTPVDKTTLYTDDAKHKEGLVFLKYLTIFILMLMPHHGTGLEADGLFSCVVPLEFYWGFINDNRISLSVLHANIRSSCLPACRICIQLQHIPRLVPFNMPIRSTYETKRNGTCKNGECSYESLLQ